MIKRKSKEARKKRYEELKKIGFNSYEANKYKDLSKSRYEKLIKQKLIANREIFKIVGGGING